MLPMVIPVLLASLAHAGEEGTVFGRLALEKEEAWSRQQNRLEAMDRDQACVAELPRQIKLAWHYQQEATAAWVNAYAFDRMQLQREALAKEALLNALEGQLKQQAQRRQHYRDQAVAARASAQRQGQQTLWLDQAIANRQSSIEYAEKTIFLLQAARGVALTVKQRLDHQARVLEHYERSLQTEALAWRHTYRGHLLSLRTRARNACPALYNSIYRDLQPAAAAEPPPR